MNDRTRQIVLYFCFLLVAGCAEGPAYLPGFERLRASGSIPDGVTETALEEGRSLFLSHCGTCHQLHWPAVYSAKQWREIVALMWPRSGLTQEQAVAVEAYLVAAAKHADTQF